MKDICLKFASKIEVDIKDLYFLYSGNPLNLELSFEECLNSEDKERNKMIIMANQIIDDNQYKKPTIIKSKEIICPNCGEIAKIKIKNYKIIIFDCKNNHETNNLFLNEYENTQNIDLSTIVCDECKKNNKSNTYNNEFYRCTNCNKDLCPLCRSKHYKDHIIVNYDKRNCICNIHNLPFYFYCETCKKNMCIICENNHNNQNNHEIKSFGKLLPNIDSLKNKKNEIRNIINKFNEKINKIIEILKNVKFHILIHALIHINILVFL